MARCLLIHINIHEQQLEKLVILPNPPLPEGLLGIFQGGLLLMLSHLSLKTSKRCSKATAYSQVPGFPDLNKKRLFPRGSRIRNS